MILWFHILRVLRDEAFPSTAETPMTSRLATRLLNLHKMVQYGACVPSRIPFCLSRAGHSIYIHLMEDLGLVLSTRLLLIFFSFFFYARGLFCTVPVTHFPQKVKALLGWGWELVSSHLFLCLACMYMTMGETQLAQYTLTQDLRRLHL
jgi:hypothetical protein